MHFLALLQGQGAALVPSHEAGVTENICGQDRCSRATGVPGSLRIAEGASLSQSKLILKKARTRLDLDRSPGG